MPEPKVLTFATRDEWLAGRKNFITASDVAAILGFDKNRTAAHVFLEKRGAIEPEPEDPSKKAGRKLERLVVDWYQEETGYDVTAHQHVLEVHPEIPWLAVSPDATAITHFKDKRNVEAKTGNNFNKDPEERYGENGTDMVPRRNIPQAQCQMFVRGLVITDQPVLIGGSDFRIYYLPRSEKFIQYMLACLIDFKARLDRGEPPAIDYNHNHALELVQQLHRDIEARTIDLPLQYFEVAKALQAARAAKNTAERIEKVAKATLFDGIGTAEFGRIAIPGRDPVIVHRRAIPKNFAAKAATSRTEIHLKVKGLPDDEDDD